MNSLKWILVIGALFVGYTLYRDDDLPNGAYIAVYGKDQCSITQSMLSSLREAGVEHKYFRIPDPDHSDRLHTAMQEQGLSVRRYLLPVVDTNGSLTIRPQPSQVIDNYREAKLALASQSQSD